MNALLALADAGQSVWYDNIRRGLLESGELARYLSDYAVTGVTSNPTIFERAIVGSTDYDRAIRAHTARGELEAEALFFVLALEDITAAADLLAPIHTATGGVDGYVSIEVSPTLAGDTAGTVAAGRDLFERAGRPNVMVKVPGTAEGLGAVEELIAAGVPVNVTLLFSTDHYAGAAEAYLRGLERRAEGGLPLGVASVASVFVSRWDSAADPRLPEELKAKTGIASAGVTYAAYRQLLASERWAALAGAGARPQRVLWASTGTKDPHLPDTYYVAALAAPDTVDTVPEAALLAFADHGSAKGPGLGAEPTGARATLAAVEAAGVGVDALAAELQAQGLDSFAASFARLLESIEEKVHTLHKGETAASERLGPLREASEAAIADLGRRDAVRRAYGRDHTLWAQDPTEVADRLGWLWSPAQMEEQAGELDDFAHRCRADGLTHAVLMGMGGSSLFPEVMVRTFGVAPGHLDLAVLDTTDPAAIARLAGQVPLERTLFVAASKSGGTLETRSHLEFFWEHLRRPEQFAVITDPGSVLGDLARERGFRRVFENRPDIGGRYSALSHFGIVAAVLLGVDVHQLLARAGHMTAAVAPCVAPAENPAVRLGAVMGAAAKAGRDKLTLVLPEPVASFGLWVEQLIAESTGKHGTGVVPVTGEPLGPPSVYGDDRLFVALGPAPGLDELAAAGHPVVELPYRDPFDIGAEVLRFELATALAGAVLGINPFDQPNVAEAKAATSRVLEEGASELADGSLAELLGLVRPGDYLAIHAYVDPGDAGLAAGIEAARLALRDRYRVATTVGIGPRFLHSTGQLHKGGPPTGVFIQVVGPDAADLPIPGQPFGFSALKRAQADGDLETLRAHGLRAARVSLDDLLAFGNGG